MKNIALKFDSKAIIRLLGVQLYDTPMAMLRENVQNGFDAVKMRQKRDLAYADPYVKITITDNQVIVADNGIGMDQHNLEENFWTAGKSGKDNEESRKAGVVGHFGIGALANFGVCSSLDVDTHKIGTNTRYKSHAERDKLDGEQITIDEKPDETDSYGTTITATLDGEHRFDIEDAKSYLIRFVQYAEVPIYLNGELISQHKQGIETVPENSVRLDGEYEDMETKFSYRIVFLNRQPMNPQLEITDITLFGQKEMGVLYLNNSTPELFGLNNGFGLANLNVYSQFGFGGFANFSFLEPTAGREAIAKTCTDRVQTLLNKVEIFWATTVAGYSLADGYRSFLVYVNNHFDKNLAKKIKVQSFNVGSDDIALGSIDANAGGGFYKGQDTTILESHKSAGKPVYRIAQDNPRRNIQLRYLRAIGVKELDDSVQITHVYTTSEMELKEFMLLAEVKRVIEDDYILDNFDVCLAEISHGVQIMARREDKFDFVIYISRECGDLKIIYESYKEKYVLFTPQVKDFVRTSLYRQFSDYIPKDKKERAAYIDASYQKRKEEIIIRESDVSDDVLLFERYRKNEITTSQFLEEAKKIRRVKQEQVVTQRQVDDVENVVKTAALVYPAQQMPPKTVSDEQEVMAQPPILELDNPTDKKLLKTDNLTPVLHFNKLFVNLSSNMNRDNRSFFMLPHTTKVIWSTHRIIYIFTEYTGTVSLYYVMELKKKLPSEMTGGRPVASTTIITKKKIFVPVPNELIPYFDFTKDPELIFYVYFDKVN